MMSNRGKGRGPDPQQLTLFAYQARKSRVESGSDFSDCDPLDKSLLGEDDHMSDSDDDTTSKTKATVSGDENTVYQDNHITLDKPSGSMTIIINNGSSTPAASSISNCNRKKYSVEGK